jgi:predicted amidohydrolase YtcJ
MTSQPTSAPSSHRPHRTLLRGGTVYTPADPFATALLIEDEHVRWVGGETLAERHAADVDELVDLAGALVAPAFVDAHTHLTSAGLALTGLDLSGARSLHQALDAVASHVRARPDSVVLGHGWDETSWPQDRPPSVAELDRAAGDARVYLSRVDMHSALASSALRAGVPELTGAAGYQASGPLRQDAHHLVRTLAFRSVPEAQRQDARRAARARAAELGVGALHECGVPAAAGGEADLVSLFELAATEPGPYVFGYWGELGGAATARRLGAVGAAGDLCVDGSIGSRTAALREPYADQADTCGNRYLDAETIAEHLADCARAGVQPGFHVIGDWAAEAVATGLELAAKQVGTPALTACQPRLEHVEMLTERSIERLVEFGVVASVQPAFDAAWGGEEGMYARRLGARRARTLNPFATLARAGVPLAIGSDAPVTPLDPWGGVRAAAFHHNPEHRISVRAAFNAATRGGWRALGKLPDGMSGRDETGVLTPGAPATLAVWRVGELVVRAPDERVAAWSTDPASGVTGLPDLSPDAEQPACLRTIVRGRTVYARQEGR